MAEYNWCHGPECHTKSTTDRVRGGKGNKVLRTRKIRLNTWNRNNVWSHFCSQSCWTDFMYKHWSSAIALGPRNEPLETSIEDPRKETKTSPYGYTWTNTVITVKEVPTQSNT